MGGARPYYPVFLDVHGKRCLVIGGGEVALRKVRSLLEHGARVEVVAPQLCPKLSELVEMGEVQARLKSYENGDIEGAFLVIAATDQREVNRKVFQEARERGVLVNVVDSPEESDFILPSYLRRGSLTIAISSSGVSPALSRKLKDRLEENFGEEYSSLLELVGEVRAEIKVRGLKVSADAWQKALDLDLLAELVRSGEKEKAKKVLLRSLEALD